jgi:AmmeMemoRadiSam system protein B
MSTTIIREAKGSGRWFSSNSSSLRREVEEYINAAKIEKPTSGRIVSALAPHAGFQYSGYVAGFTFRAIRDQPVENLPEVLVIAGFSHSCTFNGVVLMDGKSIRTPLGEHPLDIESSQFLRFN